MRLKIEESLEACVEVHQLPEPNPYRLGRPWAVVAHLEGGEAKIFFRSRKTFYSAVLEADELAKQYAGEGLIFEVRHARTLRPAKA